MTFLFRCPSCGSTAEQAEREPAPTCICKGRLIFVVMVRDYRAEGANVDLRGLR